MTLTETQPIPATLCYVVVDGKVLLIRKKQGLGAGKFNGPGGKLDDGEQPEHGAAREVAEETGILPLGLTKCGVVAFYYGQDERPDWLVHVFVATGFKGTATETSEATPRWFGLDEIPYDEMWPDDRIWMPLMLEGKTFMGKFFYDKDGATMLRHELIAQDSPDSQ